MTVRRLGSVRRTSQASVQTKIIIKRRHNMLIMVLLTRIQLRPSFRLVFAQPSP
jgi:hypothetical protein